MATQRMPLWAAEADIDEDLQDVDMAYPQGSGTFEDSQIQQYDESTLLALQQQIAQQAALAQIPDVVKLFIINFHKAVLENNLPDITVAYESGWNKYTEKFYAKTEWPEAEAIAPLVNDDPIFLILYRELYYRHVYSRLQPNIDDRFHSYENSCELFNYLLNSDGPVTLQLPEQWLWDIIDEFIYQFQVFCTWRSKSKNKTEDELIMLSEGGGIWSSYSVLNVLYSLIQKSKINECIVAQQQGKSAEEISEIVGPYGSLPLYRNLGYFSLVGLLRVHVLLGDFTLALKVLDDVDLGNKRSSSSQSLTRVTACHVTTYYHVGFCYVMLQRYPDAIRTFVNILNFIMRMRQYHTRSYQYDQINKTADRMYALFAVCHSLSPSRLDDNIANISKERFGEQWGRMQKGGKDALGTYDELFLYACPKFISASSLLPPPQSEGTLSSVADPTHRHLSLFLACCAAYESLPALTALLKLYTSLDCNKLAKFTADRYGSQEEDEEAVVQELMLMKQLSKSVSRVGSLGQEKHASQAHGSLLDGQTISTSDLNFVIDGNMVHIAESTVGRRYAGWFIKNTERTARVLDELKNSPLPINVVRPQEKEGQKENTTSKKVAWGGAGAK